MITPVQYGPESWMHTRYYIGLARHYGVPFMWLEDACQEIALRVAMAAKPRKVVAHNACIDFVRQFGPRTRRGKARPETEYTSSPPPVVGYEEVTLGDMLADPVDQYAVADEVMDFEAMVAKRGLTFKAHKAVAKKARGDYMDNAELSMLNHVRRNVWKLA